MLGGSAVAGLVGTRLPRADAGKVELRSGWGGRSASDNTRWVVASCPRMVSSNASVDFVDFPVRHVAVSPHLQRLQLVQALANGGGLDYCDDRPARRQGEQLRLRRRSRDLPVSRDARGGTGVCRRTRGSRSSPTRAPTSRSTEAGSACSPGITSSSMCSRSPRPTRPRSGSTSSSSCRPRAGRGRTRTAARCVGRGRWDALVVSGLSGLRDEEYEVRSEPPFECLGIEGVREIRPDLRGAYAGSTTTRASAASPIPTCCTWTGRTWTPSTARTCDASSV